MFDGISVVSGTQRQIYAAFGLEALCVPATKSTNLHAIDIDINRSPFFSQALGDFEKFAQLWVDFDSSTFIQGDTRGGAIPDSVGGPTLIEKYPDKTTDILERCEKRTSSFGYLHDIGEASGITCSFVRDPEDPSFYYWFISILHDGTGSPDERTMHVITNLPARQHAPIYLKEKAPELKPQKIRNHRGLLAFLKSHLHSYPVYSLFEKSLNKDCTFKDVQEQELGFSAVFTDKAIKVDDAVNAKAQISHKVYELSGPEHRDDNNAFLVQNKEISVTGIAELRDSVYALHKYGLDIQKTKPESDEGQKIIDFSLELNKQAKIIANSNTEQEFKTQKKIFDTALNKGKADLSWQQSTLRTILEAIFIAMSGLGVTMFMGTLLEKNFSEKFALPFFRKKTVGEKLSDKTKSLTSKLSFKRKQ